MLLSLIIMLSRRCSHISHLDLNFLKDLTSTDIISLLKELPNIKVLNMCKNQAVDNEVLRILSETCRHLEVLTIQSCWRVNDLGIRMLYSQDSQCRLSLQSLDISKCTQITLREILNLVKEFKSLTQLHCRDSHSSSVIFMLLILPLLEYHHSIGCLVDITTLMQMKLSIVA